jgi:hypothetical protein
MLSTLFRSGELAVGVFCSHAEPRQASGTQQMRTLAAGLCSALQGVGKGEGSCASMRHLASVARQHVRYCRAM